MLVPAEIVECVSLWIMAAGALIAAAGGLRTRLRPAASESGALNQQ